MITTGRDRPERAFLVAVELRRRSRSDKDIDLPAGARQARSAASDDQSESNEEQPAIPVSRHSSAARGMEEALDELRELARSAGAEIAGEFMQRRDQADPATLIGKGKLQELAG